MRLDSCGRSFLAIFCTSFLFSASVALGAPQQQNAKLEKQLATIASGFGGKVTFAAVNLKTGQRVGQAAVVAAGGRNGL